MNWHSDQAILFMRSCGGVQEVFKFIESSFSPWLPQFLYVYFLCVVHCIDAYLNLCTAVHTSNSLYNFTHRHTYVHSTDSIAYLRLLPPNCNANATATAFLSFSVLTLKANYPILFHRRSIALPIKRLITVFLSSWKLRCLISTYLNHFWEILAWVSFIEQVVFNNQSCLTRMSWISLPVKLYGFLGVFDSKTPSMF